MPEPAVMTRSAWYRLGDRKPPARRLCIVSRRPSLPRGVAVDVQALRWNQNADSWYQGAVDPVPAHDDDLWAFAPTPDLAIWDQATRPPAAEPAPETAPDGVKVTTLEWSKPLPPTEECPYDHMTAASPLGEYSIQYPDPLLFLDGRRLGTHSGLEAAKNAAQEHLRHNTLDHGAEPPEPPTLEWLDPQFGDTRDTFGYQEALALGGRYRIVWRRFGDDELVLEWHSPDTRARVRHLGTALNVMEARHLIQHDYAVRWEVEKASLHRLKLRFGVIRGSV